MLGLTDIDDVILVMNYQSNSAQKVKNLCVTQPVRHRDRITTRQQTRSGHFVWFDGVGGGGSKLVLKLLPG